MAASPARSGPLKFVQRALLAPRSARDSMQATDELEEDPAYQAWLRKKLAEQSDAGSVADLSLPASQPGAPDQASAALHSLSLTAADGPQPQQEDDPWYAMGSEFLRLPARASRDGDQPGEVVGTAIHVELLGYSATPPYLAVAFEPATGAVVDCRSVRCPGAFEAYEEVLWGLIGSYMRALDRRTGPSSGAALRHKPAVISTTDSALADYMFGLLQGCGCGVVCVGATASVQWPSARLASLLSKRGTGGGTGGGAGGGASPSAGPPRQPDDAADRSADAVPEAPTVPPTVRSVQEAVLAELVASGG